MYEPNSRRGGTDLVEVVKPRYAAAFEATVAGASTLEFPGLGFTDSEARELLDVIVEHCTALKVLDLSDNNALTVLDVSRPLAKTIMDEPASHLARMLKVNTREISLASASHCRSRGLM